MTKALLSPPTNELINGTEAVASKFGSAISPWQHLPAGDWSLLVGSGALLPALPEKYGGRDRYVEMCRVVEPPSEWNLLSGMNATTVSLAAGDPARSWA
jgi:hypothetical protein